MSANRELNKDFELAASEKMAATAEAGSLYLSTLIAPPTWRAAACDSKQCA
jgi:hypothetical protein